MKSIFCSQTLLFSSKQTFFPLPTEIISWHLQWCWHVSFNCLLYHLFHSLVPACICVYIKWNLIWWDNETTIHEIANEEDGRNYRSPFQKWEKSPPLIQFKRINQWTERYSMQKTKTQERKNNIWKTKRWPLNYRFLLRTAT